MIERHGHDRQTVDFEAAAGMVRTLCEIAGARRMIDGLREGFEHNGVLAAVAARDDRAIFDWLMHALSFQGVADGIAARYIEAHGQATADDLDWALAAPSPCPRLRSYWSFTGCRFRKAAHACAEPGLLPACRLPSLPLRNGLLNQLAFSLWLFMRDVAGGDFVGWIERRLDACGGDARAGLVVPLRHVHGVADKILSMTLADLLIGAGADRPGWTGAGCRLIAVDTLVHNWLHRTGILQGLGTAHPYGAACYGPGGCEGLLQALAGTIDARAFGNRYPACFPRFVQNAVWRFCAMDFLDRCNGNRIDDRGPCRDEACPLAERCGRVALR